MNPLDRRLAVLLLLLASSVRQADDESRTEYEVPCREASWSALCAIFDPAWILPEPPDETTNLVLRVKQLAAARWESDDDRFGSLGDLVGAADALGSAARADLLDRFGRDQPEAWSTWGAMLTELLADEGLRPTGWDPDDDLDDDGLFVDRPWSLEEASRSPWSRIEGNRDVHQAAAFVHADLEAIKDAENDYATYPGYAGAEYEAIYPVPASHVRAAPDDEATDRVALQLSFRIDLPFPFSDYSCLLRILNRIDADGHLVTDIYSTSEDFYWLAGRDVFVPVTTSTGDFAGTLVVRWFGFDLEDVPDGSGARKAGLRAGLGRLKLRAESAYAEVRDGPRTVAGAVPPFVVRGDRRWQR